MNLILWGKPILQHIYTGEFYTEALEEWEQLKLLMLIASLAKEALKVELITAGPAGLFIPDTQVRSIADSQSPRKCFCPCDTIKIDV